MWRRGQSLRLVSMAGSALRGPGAASRSERGRGRAQRPRQVFAPGRLGHRCIHHIPPSSPRSLFGTDHRPEHPKDRLSRRQPCDTTEQVRRCLESLQQPTFSPAGPARFVGVLGVPWTSWAAKVPSSLTVAAASVAVSFTARAASWAGSFKFCASALRTVPHPSWPRPGVVEAKFPAPRWCYERSSSLHRRD